MHYCTLILIYLLRVTILHRAINVKFSFIIIKDVDWVMHLTFANWSRTLIRTNKAMKAGHISLSWVQLQHCETRYVTSISHKFTKAKLNSPWQRGCQCLGPVQRWMAACVAVTVGVAAPWCTDGRTRSSEYSTPTGPAAVGPPEQPSGQ